MNIRLTKEQKVKVPDAKGIYAIMQQVLLREHTISRNQEHFWVIGLDKDDTLLFIELTGLGGVSRVNTSPSEFFQMAIYKEAVKVVLVHNHPSGSLQVSEGDRQFTDWLLKVGKIIDIAVSDHLVITETGYTSFADEGIMETLRKSSRFTITGPERELLEGLKMQEERKQGRKDVAKRMKADGYDAQTIKKLTGLRLSEIKKL